MFTDKVHAFALGAKTGVFQGQQGGDGVAVVNLCRIHIGRFEPGHCECALRGRPDRCVQHVLGIGRRLERQVLAEAGDPRRPLARPCCHLFGSDNHRGATGHRHDDFQYMQRVGNFFTGQHLLDGQRLAVKHRFGVVLGIGALIDGDFCQCPRVIAILRGIALGDHGVAGVLAHMPVRQVELGFGSAECRAVPAIAHGPGHPAGVFIRAQRRHACRQYAQYRLAQTQLDGSRRAPDHTHRRTAAEVDHLGKIQAHAQVLGGHRRHEHRGFMKLRAVDHQAVEIRCLQTGIL